MSFIGSDERLILMDSPTYEGARLPEEDLKKLVDAGIRTGMIFYVNWNVIEPTQGTRDWSYFDELITTMNGAGMKAILQVCTRYPEWMPSEWMLRDTFQEHRVPSFWNPDAWAYSLDFIKEAQARYNIPGKSMTMNSWLSDGETLFPNSVCVYDAYAQRAFAEQYERSPEMAMDGQVDEFLKAAQIKMLMELQAIHIENENREIWHVLHPALAGYHGNGCAYIEDYLIAERAAWPDAVINHLYCTWVQWGGEWPLMESWRDKYGEQIWGGSEYAENVVSSTRVAIERGIRGLLIGPTHSFTGHKRVEPWMLLNIKESLKLW